MGCVKAAYQRRRRTSVADAVCCLGANCLLEGAHAEEVQDASGQRGGERERESVSRATARDTQARTYQDEALQSYQIQSSFQH